MRRRGFWSAFGKYLLFIPAFALAVYWGSVVTLTLVYRWVDPPVTALMVLRSLQGTKVLPARPVPYAKLPTVTKTGIVYLEDHAFWTHHGIVWGAIREAWEANVESGQIERGGSTITQQLAKNLFLFPDKLYLRKTLEVLTAMTMELLLPKQRILELYLNHIEWGPGVFGIEAGARYQFGTGVRNLTKEQLARLLAIVTNPRAFTVRTFAENRGMAARYGALMAKEKGTP